MAFDALTVTVRPNNPVKQLSMADLKVMWAPGAQGTVIKWNLANPAYPGAPLTLYGPGDDSGTFEFG